VFFSVCVWCFSVVSFSEGVGMSVVSVDVGLVPQRKVVGDDVELEVVVYLCSDDVEDVDTVPLVDCFDDECCVPALSIPGLGEGESWAVVGEGEVSTVYPGNRHWFLFNRFPKNMGEAWKVVENYLF